MELDDPNLPAAANDWMLASSDQVRAWITDLQNEAEPLASLANTLLSLAESQARIIADLSLRITALE